MERDTLGNEVKIGDTVTIRVGNMVRTGEVHSVMFWNYWMMELVHCNDRFGDYCNWKQQYDGGEIVEVKVI